MKVTVKNIYQHFTKVFAQEPLLVFSPGRINIIGEHTDYNDGFVFPAAIDLGIVVALQRSDNTRSVIYSYDKEEYHYFDETDQLKSIPNGGWRNYVLGIFIELEKRKIKVPPVTISFGGNIPTGAGLSSSAAVENGVVFGLNTLFNLGLTKKEMIFISQGAEQNVVGVNCGIMDQYASMFGQKDKALLLDCQSLEASPKKIKLTNHELLLINSNVKHNLAENAYNKRRESCERVSRQLNTSSLRHATIEMLQNAKSKIQTEDYEKALYVVRENDRVLQANQAIEKQDFSLLGQLLYASHKGLQTNYKVSCDELDFLVEQARESPHVIGARMVGGGFGGCTINLVKAGKRTVFFNEVSLQFKKKYGKACTAIKVNIGEGTRLINNN